jgi:hypothetical protein
MSSHEFELLIPVLLFELKRIVDTSSPGSKIQEHFEPMMSDPRLLDHQLSVLARVIRTDVDNIHAVLFFESMSGSILVSWFDCVQEF